MAEEKIESRTRSRWTPRLWLALRCCIAILALVALQRELTHVDLAAVGRAIADFGPRPIVLAVACAAASFLVLGLFEVMALHDTAKYDGCETAANVRPRHAFLTSFVANAFSQSIGLSVVTGSAVRLRSYAKHRVKAGAIAHISAFVTITATLGLLAAGAVALIESPTVVPAKLIFSLRAFGIALSLPAIAYLGWALIGKGHIGGKRWSMRPPTIDLALSQVALSVIDWLLAGTVLFVLIPGSAQIGYLQFLGIYLVAQTAGVVSHVPGGFGVFEGAFLSLLSAATRGTSSATLAASLVMYRIVYYLAPLLIAIVIAAFGDRMSRAAKLRPIGPAGLLVPETANAA